jgi:hypothetical protein
MLPQVLSFFLLVVDTCCGVSVVEHPGVQVLEMCIVIGADASNVEGC